MAEGKESGKDRSKPPPSLFDHAVDAWQAARPLLRLEATSDSIVSLIRRSIWRLVMRSRARPRAQTYYVTAFMAISTVERTDLGSTSVEHHKECLRKLLRILRRLSSQFGSVDAKVFETRFDSKSNRLLPAADWRTDEDRVLATAALLGLYWTGKQVFSTNEVDQPSTRLVTTSAQESLGTPAGIDLADYTVADSIAEMSDIPSNLRQVARDLSRNLPFNERRVELAWAAIDAIGEKSEESLNGTALGHSAAEDRYEIVGQCGEGSYSRVYTADDTLLQRKVAIKFFFPSASTRIDILEQARVLARASHPSIVQVFEVCTLADPVTGAETFAIVMEQIDGRRLEQVVDDGPLSRDFVKSTTEAIANVVDHLHGMGLNHGDLHSGNVMIVGDSETVKVIDIHYFDELAAHSTRSQASRISRDIFDLSVITYELFDACEDLRAHLCDLRKSTRSLRSVAEYRDSISKFLESRAAITEPDLSNRLKGLLEERDIRLFTSFYDKMFSSGIATLGGDAIIELSTKAGVDKEKTDVSIDIVEGHGLWRVYRVSGGLGIFRLDATVKGAHIYAMLHVKEYRVLALKSARAFLEGKIRNEKELAELIGSNTMLARTIMQQLVKHEYAHGLFGNVNGFITSVTSKLKRALLEGGRFDIFDVDAALVS